MIVRRGEENKMIMIIIMILIKMHINNKIRNENEINNQTLKGRTV